MLVRTSRQQKLQRSIEQNRERVRRRRERWRKGVASYRVEAIEELLIEALIDSEGRRLDCGERLTAEQSADKKAVERAIGRLLNDWARRWLQKL